MNFFLSIKKLNIYGILNIFASDQGLIVFHWGGGGERGGQGGMEGVRGELFNLKFNEKKFLIFDLSILIFD